MAHAKPKYHTGYDAKKVTEAHLKQCRFTFLLTSRPMETATCGNLSNTNTIIAHVQCG